MPTIAPWLQVPDYIGAMSRGAGLGLQARQLDISEEEAAARQAEAGDRLRLAYNQLASEEKRASANAQAMADYRRAQLKLSAQRQAALDQYRQENMQRQIDQGQQRLDLAQKALDMKSDKADATPAMAHVGTLEGADPTAQFLIQPTGHAQMIPREKDISPGEKMRLTLSAYNAMKPAAGEDESSAGYQSRTNAAGQILKQLQPTKKKETSVKRVRVTSPDGKIGTIPEDQLDAALAAGYSKAE